MKTLPSCYVALLVILTIAILPGQSCVPGAPNLALMFDGIDDRCEVPHNPALDGFDDFCIEFWFRIGPQSAWNTLMQKLTSNSGSLLDDAWSVGTNNGTLVVELMTGSSYTLLSGVTVITDQMWHHAALTRGGSTVHLFVDGVQDGQVNHAGTLNSTTIPLSIGSNLMPAGPGGFIAGEMDEIRIWNINRSPAQITSQMSFGLLGSEPGLVAYYRFDEGAGQTIHDASFPPYDGALGGTAAAEPSDPAWITPSLVITCGVPSVALGAQPSIGSALPLAVSSPLTPSAPFVVAFAVGTNPGIPLADGRTIPLNFDAMLLFSLDPANGIFVNNAGVLDLAGAALVPPVVNIPSSVVLLGQTIYAALVTADPMTITGVGGISPPLAITFTL